VQRQKNARLSPRQCSILTSRGSTKTGQSIGFSWPNKPKGWVRWRVVNPIEHICTLATFNGRRLPESPIAALSQAVGG
jgi:hypothetical protein